MPFNRTDLTFILTQRNPYTAHGHDKNCMETKKQQEQKQQHKLTIK